MIEKFLTTEQVASILQVHPFTILKFIKQGKINGVKLGRGYRIQESEVERFLTANSVHAPKVEKKKVEEEPIKEKRAKKEKEHYEIEKPVLNVENQDGDHYYII